MSSGLCAMRPAHPAEPLSRIAVTHEGVQMRAVAALIERLLSH